ncbi:MAG: family membership [Bryobacteraceae bacterium]
MTLGRRIFKGVAILAMLGVLAVLVLFGSLWLEHRTGITLPLPTGPFAVGRVMYAWAGDAPPGAKRELVVWIWYPAAVGQSPAAMEDYLPAPWRAAIERDRGALISKFLTRDLSKVHAHSIRNAAVSPQRPSYPVAIVRAGASAGIANYTTLAEDLASHGYIVVGFDAPYRAQVVVFPDGRVMTRTPQNNPELCLELPDPEQARCVNKLLMAWTADIAFVLDRLAQLNGADPSGKFKGRLDLAHVGVFGHSFGGAAAAQFCHDDSRCQAGIDLDGAPFGSVVQEGLHQPFMFVLSDEIHSSGPETRRVLADVQSIYDRLPPESRLRLAIRGANHFLFSDDGALLKSHLVLGTLRMFGVVGIDGRRQLAVTTYCVDRFFDAYLKQASAARLQIASPLYPEIQLLE